MKNSVLIAAVLCSFCRASGSVSGSEILTVHSGEDVTLESANMAYEGSVTFWLRVINQTKTSCIAVINGARRVINYCEGFQAGSFKVTVNDSNVSLKIKHVNISDTGMYLCGLNQAGNLKLTVQHLHVIEKPSNNMKLIFPGAQSGLLLIAVTFLFIQMKKLQRAQHGDKEQHQLQILDSAYCDQPADSDTRRKRRSARLEPEVVNVATTKRRGRN